jgi:hypothetical protein
MIDPQAALSKLHALIAEFQYTMMTGKEVTHENVVRQLLEECPYPILLQYIDTNFYRVREGDISQFGDPSHFLSNVSDFKVNPDPSRIGLGRCNLPRTQVHYCAFEERTAQYEAIYSFRQAQGNSVDKSHIAYIGRWQSTRVLRLASLIDREEDRDLFAQHHPEWVDYVEVLVWFLKGVFTIPAGNNPAIYTFTATVSKIMMERFDGVVYPSSITNGKGTNAALNPTLVEEGSLKFGNAARIRRHAYNDDGARVDNWLGMICSPDGELLWLPSMTTFLHAASKGHVLGAHTNE